MMKYKSLLTIIATLLCSLCSGQSCEIFEIPSASIYLYPSEKGKNFSVLNDSVSFSIEKLDGGDYRVQKLLFNAPISDHKYRYRGKKRNQVFKVKTRELDKVRILRKCKVICLLES